MRKQNTKQSNFAAGELSENALRADDVKIRALGLRKALNMRATAWNNAETRPGRRAIFQGEERVDDIRLPVGTLFRLCFAPGRLRVRNEAGAVVAAFTQVFNVYTGVNDALPWTSGGMADISWARFDDEIVICWRNSRPLVLKLSIDGSSFSILYFDFDTDVTGRTRQPFYRYAPKGVTMRPDGYQGNVTLNFSSTGTLGPNHVGVRVRYKGRELIVNTVAGNGASATATCIETLPQTYQIELSSIAGFNIGDTVIGSQSGVTGEIFSISSPTVFVISDNWIGYVNGEFLVSSRAKGTIVTTSVSSVPLDTTEWDEALMSTARGWPAGVASDRSRLVLHSFPQAATVIAWSAVGNAHDMLVAADASSPIVETVPSESKVVHVVGGQDQFILCDTAIYYIPISADNPLVPGSIEFRFIDQVGAARVAPQSTSEGAVFIDANRTRVQALIATGMSARPYLIKDISEYSDHLIKSPVSIAIAAGSGVHPERYVYVVNSDGTLAVGRYNRDEDFVGWFPWEGTGLAKWATARVSGATIVSTYATDATRFIAEVVDETALLDHELPASAPGANFDADKPVGKGPFWMLAGQTVIYRRGARNLGFRQIDANGNLILTDDDDPDGSEKIGLFFSVEVEPFIPHPNDGPPYGQGMTKRRVRQSAWTLRRNVALQCGNRHVPAYKLLDDNSIDPPVRVETQTFRHLGRTHDPRIVLYQRSIGRMTIMEFRAEVTV